MIGANAVPLVSRVEEATEGQSAVFVFGLLTTAADPLLGLHRPLRLQLRKELLEGGQSAKKHSTKTPMHPE